MTRLLSVALALFTVGTPSLLACPPVVRSYTPYYAPTTYREVVVVREAAVYVAQFVPVVTVGVAASVPVAPAVAPVAAPAAAPMPAAQPVAADPCASLRAEVNEMKAMLRQMQTQGQNSPLPPPGAVSPSPPTDPRAAPAGNTPGYVGVLMTKCASCHTAGKLKPKVPFALVNADGTIPRFTPEQTKAILRATMGDDNQKPTMPPAGPLDDQSFGALLQIVNQK